MEEESEYRAEPGKGTTFVIELPRDPVRNAG